jgi:hypothetical protein
MVSGDEDEVEMLLLTSVGVSVTPVPVGEVKVNVGVEVQPELLVKRTEDGTPDDEVIVPVTVQCDPPPLDVNAVELAYPVPPERATVTPPRPPPRKFVVVTAEPLITILTPEGEPEPSDTTSMS